MLDLYVCGYSFMHLVGNVCTVKCYKYVKSKFLTMETLWYDFVLLLFHFCSTAGIHQQGLQKNFLQSLMIWQPADASPLLAYYANTILHVTIKSYLVLKSLILCYFINLFLKTQTNRTFQLVFWIFIINTESIWPLKRHCTKAKPADVIRSVYIGLVRFCPLNS